MPALSMTQALRRLEAHEVDPVYILFGEETYLQQEYLTALTDRILEGAARDFNYDVLYADNDDLAEALSLARTLPMMTPHRVVVFHGLQQLRKADLQHLIDYAADPSETTALFCCSTDSDVNKMPQTLRQKAMGIACKRLQGSQLQQWVKRTVTQHGAEITGEAVAGLLQEHDNDLQMLTRELDKLSTYAGEGGEITLADVQTVSYASRHHSLFALSDALGSRQAPQALAMVDRLLQQGEPPLVVLSMIIRHLRLLWSVKQLARQRQDIGGMAKTLGLPPQVCRQLVGHSRQVSTDHLQRLYGAAIDADLAFKSSNKPPQAILEGLIFALCTEH
ncbi:MAG: DNA polymerase III subunit delta [Candidatus Tectomicrobia bacterium]|nr:DNA polymerase III subunit delta [Candidatus Tectomicrobia bacterium]